MASKEREPITGVCGRAPNGGSQWGPRAEKSFKVFFLSGNPLKLKNCCLNTQSQNYFVFETGTCFRFSYKALVACDCK